MYETFHWLLFGKTLSLGLGCEEFVGLNRFLVWRAELHSLQAGNVLATWVPPGPSVVPVADLEAEIRRGVGVALLPVGRSRPVPSLVTPGPPVWAVSLTSALLPQALAHLSEPFGHLAQLERPGAGFWVFSRWPWGRGEAAHLGLSSLCPWCRHRI